MWREEVDTVGAEKPQAGEAILQSRGAKQKCGGKSGIGLMNGIGSLLDILFMDLCS